MTAKVFSATNVGFEGRLIEVECDATNGLPTLQIVGLGNKAIDEAKERVRSAIKNTGLEFPKKRITINLAPANLPKHGAHFDLAIAMALLVVSGQLPQDTINNTLFAGELSLNGDLRPIPGTITYAEVAYANGLQSILLPTASATQATLVEGIEVKAARSLREIYLHLSGQQRLPSESPLTISPSTTPSLIDDVMGQEHAKRALLIAAAGRHNILLHGPPGAGKTMLARALASLLPPLTRSEVIDVTKMYSLAGHYQKVVTERPFRSPHHSASHVALAGGGSNPRPGEISLAHRGVLFLDELPEYSRQSLETLRQPLEDHCITIARANDSVTYPADFMLVATQNPCPCGYAGDNEHECTCSPFKIQQYQKKISGPLLDRIDMVVEISRVAPSKLLNTKQDFSDLAYSLRDIISDAQKQQQLRFNSLTKTNASISSKEIQQFVTITPEAKTLAEQAATALHLSARSYFKVIKVARTIADLEKSNDIEVAHVSEALQYRPHNNL